MKPPTDRSLLRAPTAGLVGALLLLLFPTIVLTGCSSSPAPTYDHVRNQTIAAMQKITDRLPSEAIVERRPDGDPYSCGSTGDASPSQGYMYTGHWEVTVPASFDSRGFVKGLVGALGDGWRKTQSVDWVDGATDVTQIDTGVGVSVMAYGADGKSGIDILATSRCGTRGNQ